MAGYIKAFENFCFSAKLDKISLDGLSATLKVLPETFDAISIKIMLTDEDDCDELLEKYGTINKTPANENFAMRQELIGLVSQFAASDESKDIPLDETPAAAAPAAAAVPAKNPYITAFENFCFSAKLDKISLDGLSATLKVLPETFDAISIKIMLTDEDDCDELLEKYGTINKTPANENFAMRQELIGLVSQFAASDESKDLPLEAEGAPAAAAPAPAAVPAKNPYITAFENFCFGAKLDKISLDGLSATLKVLPETFDAISIKIMLTDEDDCDELLEKYGTINKTPANENFAMRQELIGLVSQFAASDESKDLPLEAEGAPAAAAPAPAATEKSPYIAAFENFCFGAKLEKISLDGLSDTLKVLPETFDAISIKIMLTDEDDCDELLEKYSAINKTPANENFAVRQELVGLVGQFAASDACQELSS